MKEVLSLCTFGILALCFVVFLTVFKPDAISAVPAPMSASVPERSGHQSTWSNLMPCAVPP